MVPLAAVMSDATAVVIVVLLLVGWFLCTLAIGRLLGTRRD
jgi:NADH:ubiquinone oxidoreductase subunit 3 (subunit A)